MDMQRVRYYKTFILLLKKNNDRLIQTFNFRKDEARQEWREKKTSAMLQDCLSESDEKGEN